MHNSNDHSQRPKATPVSKRHRSTVRVARRRARAVWPTRGRSAQCRAGTRIVTTRASTSHTGHGDEASPSGCQQAARHTTRDVRLARTRSGSPHAAAQPRSTPRTRPTAFPTQKHTCAPGHDACVCVLYAHGAWNCLPAECARRGNWWPLSAQDERPRRPKKMNTENVFQ